jgi:AhpD family alkylhydroperoxidase
MQPRMSNPATLLPDAVDGIQALVKATRKGGVSQATLELVHLRASQINGCSFCVYGGVQSAKKAGETDERLSTVAAWREAPY